MRYHIVGSEEIFDNIDDAVEYCIDEDYHSDDDDYFEEWINEMYGSVTIGGYEYSAYNVLDNMGDLCDFIDSYRDSENERDREDAVYELRHALVGDTISCQNYQIEVLEDEEVPYDDTGDYDGDEDVIDRVRRFYDEQILLAKQKEEQELKDDNDVMSLFQVI